jgi:peptidoglycan/xylan/chitin deacetylase (PgdA/CDA1 family)
MIIRRPIRELRRVTRWLKNPYRTRALILLYHRVVTLRSDPWVLSVAPHHFAEHLEILQQYARPLQLQHLAQVLPQGKLPARSVIVTFDDGYADNLHNAKPALERYEIPATFFLTTGHMRNEREFWWDELERLLLQPGLLPDTLHLSINGIGYRWELGASAHYSEEDFRRHQRWKAWEDSSSPRHSLYSSLWELLHPLTEEERTSVLDELLEWADAEPVVRPTHRPLSLEEASKLAQGELVEIGAHTVTHPTLSALTATSQRDEILKSRHYLQDLIGRPVRSFSYPYGRLSDYDHQTISILRQAGFACSCSNFTGVIEQDTDLFQLPRVQVQDWDGDEFAKRLLRWFNC